MLSKQVDATHLNLTLLEASAYLDPTRCDCGANMWLSGNAMQCTQDEECGRRTVFPRATVEYVVGRRLAAAFRALFGKLKSIESDADYVEVAGVTRSTFSVSASVVGHERLDVALARLRRVA